MFEKTIPSPIRTMSKLTKEQRNVLYKVIEDIPILEELPETLHEDEEDNTWRYPFDINRSPKEIIPQVALAYRILGPALSISIDCRVPGFYELKKYIYDTAEKWQREDEDYDGKPRLYKYTIQDDLMLTFTAGTYFNTGRINISRQNVY